MTTILQSCIETQFIETTPLMLKVAPTKTLELSRSSSCNYPTEINDKAMPHNMSSNHDSRGWSFLQVLSNVSSTPKETMEKENVYVHPSTKQYSSSRLSEKSLELCTENLGSETGSDIMDIGILSLSPSNSSTSEISWLKQDEKLPEEVESSSKCKVNNSGKFIMDIGILSLSPSNSSTSEISWPKQDEKLPEEVESSSKCKVNNSGKFPPPLTTISGSNSLQFRPHRQDGRLVIQAVEAPLKHTYFQAERSHGRLRLSVLEDHPIMFDSQLTRTEEYEVDDSEDDYELDVDGENDHQDEEYCQLEEDDDEEEEEEEEMEVDPEVEMGIMEKFQRLMNGRCNEGGHGNKGVRNWPELLCVGTS